MHRQSGGAFRRNGGCARFLSVCDNCSPKKNFTPPPIRTLLPASTRNSSASIPLLQFCRCKDAGPRSLSGIQGRVAASFQTLFSLRSSASHPRSMKFGFLMSGCGA